MIQLMFSLDKSLARFVESWNHNVYGLFRELFQDIKDEDAWKTGLTAKTIPVTTNPLKEKDWWNIDKSRPYSVLEGLEEVSSLVADVQTMLGRISKLTSPVVRKYLTTRFTDLLDTPSNYLAESMIRYDEFNKELIYVPFVNLVLTEPTTFLSLDDTPGSFANDYVLAVDEDGLAVEFQSPGYTARRHIATAIGFFDVSTLSNAHHVLVCDVSSDPLTIQLDPPGSFFDTIISIVVPAFTNTVTLSPAASTFEGSLVPFPVVTSPLVIAYDPATNDFKQVGEHI
jgi:hypothetical protein